MSPDRLINNAWRRTELAKACNLLRSLTWPGNGQPGGAGLLAPVKGEERLDQPLVRLLVLRVAI
jgi:hypothetical protein